MMYTVQSHCVGITGWVEFNFVTLVQSVGKIEQTIATFINVLIRAPFKILWSTSAHCLRITLYSTNIKSINRVIVLFLFEDTWNCVFMFWEGRRSNCAGC